MSDIYSQGIDRYKEMPDVVIIKNGLPMSNDDIQEELEGMQKHIKELEAILKKVNRLISIMIYHGCSYSYGFVLKDLLARLEALEGKDG